LNELQFYFNLTFNSSRGGSGKEAKEGRETAAEEAVDLSSQRGGFQGD